MKQDARSLAGSIPPIRNAWYVVAFSDEVSEKPMARRIMGKRMVMYRTEAGAPVMLDDYCAHRSMALSQGKRVNGDRIQCPYHGFEYGPNGMCTHVPSQTDVPGKMRTRSYPLVEKWQWIWAWMGDADKADESLIPNHKEFGLEDSDDYWKVQRFLMKIHGNFQLLQENLLDLSHVSYLHEGSFDAGGMALVSPDVTVDGDVIIVGRKLVETFTGRFAQFFEFPEGSKLERELVTKAWIPNFNLVSNYFRPVGGEKGKVFVRHAPFAITPETDTTCHYFFAETSNYGEEPAGQKLEITNKIIHDIFMTDQAAIESIQEAYMEFGNDAVDTSVRADEAAVRFRRLLAAKAAQEAAAK